MKEEKVKSILTYIGAVFALAFCLSPYLWMIIVSLSKNPDFLLPDVKFIPTFNNYREIVKGESVHILEYLRNSLIISALSAFFTAIFASLGAYSITRLKFPGRILIPLIMLVVSMFPQISIVGYLFKFMTGLGWINTYNALIFPYITLSMPLALWIMISYFSQISTELDKAALLDGASRFQALRKIIFPVSLPGILSTLLLAFIFSYNEFMFALTLTIDYRARTVPVAIALFEGLHGEIPWGYIMAGAVISTMPIIILAFVFQRNIVEGLTRGALKE
jgi:multiple sugar transport system permease protein